MQQCLPGGSALLITDIVSTDTAPELFHLPAAELKPFLRKCLQQQNYFRGCHPQRVISDLGILAAAGQKIRRIHLHDPWRWTTGAKAYLVCAVQADLEASG